VTVVVFMQVLMLWMWLFLYVAVDIYVELACSKYGYNEEQVIVDCRILDYCGRMHNNVITLVSD